MNISRRNFLKKSFAAAAALSLPQTMFSMAFGESKSNIREFHLSASKARVNLGAGSDFWAWTYNGQIPAPELRVKEGEIIRVLLKNYLPEETSIHWHGVPVPNSMDGVPGLTQKGVMPGESFVYEFEARPAGTYIYHSHARYQLDQGLYGSLIIEPAHSARPFDREYSLMLEDWVMKDGGGIAGPRRRSSMGMMHGMMGRRNRFMGKGAFLLEPFYDGYAVNGRIYPALEPLAVDKGERVKLRLSNPSSATIYNLRLSGHTLTVTHADGRPVKPITVDVLRIGMGERYDVEFFANNPGYWMLAAQELGFGESRLRIPIKYKGVQNKEPSLPQFHRGLRFSSYWDLKTNEESNRALIKRADIFIPQKLSGGMHSSFWTINGQVYPDAERLFIHEGEQVRLSYLNQSMMPHPMHLHGHFFKFVNPRLTSKQWISKDTIIVEPMERIDIAFIADNPGRWFHHCHNLYHMMAGMANEVVYQ